MKLLYRGDKIDITVNDDEDDITDVALVVLSLWAGNPIVRIIDVKCPDVEFEDELEELLHGPYTLDYGEGAQGLCEPATDKPSRTQADGGGSGEDVV